MNLHRTYLFTSSGYYFIAFLIIAVAAFWVPYFSKGGADVYTNAHTFLMILWFGLLITQPLLIRYRRTSTHRALGKMSYGLVPLIVVGSFLLAHSRIRGLEGQAFHQKAELFYFQVLQ